MGRNHVCVGAWVTEDEALIIRAAARSHSETVSNWVRRNMLHMATNGEYVVPAPIRRGRKVGGAPNVTDTPEKNRAREKEVRVAKKEAKKVIARVVEDLKQSFCNRCRRIGIATCADCRRLKNAGPKRNRIGGDVAGGDVVRHEVGAVEAGEHGGYTGDGGLPEDDEGEAGGLSDTVVEAGDGLLDEGAGPEPGGDGGSGGEGRTDGGAAPGGVAEGEEGAA